MEYLMTYGWAILAIVLVIAALIFLNPFRAPEVCLFGQAGFTCNEPPPQLYVEQDGRLYMNVKVWNQIGQPIEVSHVVCTNAPGNEVPDERTSIGEETVNTGDSMTLERVPCYDVDGDQIVTQANQDFRGKFVMWYNYQNDINKEIKHQVQATVNSRIVQG